MALKSYKPTTPGQRGLVLIDRSELWKGRPVKSLTEGLSKSGGRNNTGRITSRRRGGGAKRLYRIVDFKRSKFDVSAVVERIEYDPNRSAFIALIKYDDGEQSYILAPQRLRVGEKVIASAKADIKPGNTMPFSGMPIGTIIHNIEMKAGKGGQIARAAGTYAQFIGRDGGYAQLRLSSGEVRMVRQECLATVGAVSNPDNSNQNQGKAGRMRHKDNTGREGVIKPGGVQWMTAGRGIVHSEMPEQENGLLQGFQLWVNLPATAKMTAPAYQEFPASVIPSEKLEAGGTIKVIAGRTDNGTEGPVKNVYTDPLYLDVQLEPGQTVQQQIPQSHGGFLYVVKGGVQVGKTGAMLNDQSFGVLGDGEQLHLSSRAEGGRVLVIAGKRLNEPVARGGPFVMNTKQEVLKAFQDYQQGQF